MAKRRRRDQQHLRQEAARRRTYGFGGTPPDVKYRPGFPFNLLQNTKVFYVAGAVIMVGGVVVAAVAGATGRSNPDDVLDLTPTPSVSATADGSQTPGQSPTPNAKRFDKAEQVINAETTKYTATISTDKGDIVVDLFADKAPATVNSFVFLAQKGFFDGITFHRVRKDFVIQAGDPTGTGTGGPGYQTQEEPNQLPNKRTTLSMAKSSGAKAFGSQFFINVKDNVSLDFNNSGDKFYPFGEVTSGMNVVDAIAGVPIDSREKPVEPVTIKSMTIKESPK